MRAILLAVLPALLLMQGCVGSKTFSGKPKQMPEAIQAYPFGMELREFKRANSSANRQEENTMSFREVFLEENPSLDIESVVYYFDSDGSKPLYEFILNYRNTTVRDAWAENNLGPKNHADGTEWLYKSHAGYEINVWTFNNKLVFAAAIPGCEWDENKDGKIDAAVN